MNINKDNYEEYFLLFADNELKDEQKIMVEEFVNQHPELEEEFMLIKQSIFKPENDLKFDDKGSLYRQTQRIINHTNYQEIFTLYFDNELTNQQRSETEAFLTETPSLKNEFELFEKLKLQPDKKIVFPNKKRLLKKEDSGKVIPFRWWKAMAAAVLLGGGIWVGIDLQKPDNITPPDVVKSNIPARQGEPGVRLPDTANMQKVIIVAENNGIKPALKQKKSLQDGPGKLPVKSRDANTYAAVKKQKKAPLVLKENNIPVKTDKQATEIIADRVQKNIPGKLVKPIEDEADKQPQTDELVKNETVEVPEALTASYAKEESENSNNYAFYNISEEKFNKSKVGGFLRKVKRIIERKISPLNNSRNQREMAVN